MDEVTQQEHDRLTLLQLQERKSDQHRQNSVKAEFSRLGELLEDLGKCLKFEALPMDRMRDAISAIKQKTELIECWRLLEEFDAYEKREKRLKELEKALKDYL